MSNKLLLMVFVKNMQLGKVKTRLAKTIGDKDALEVYRQLLKYTNEVVSNLSAEVEIWYSDSIETEHSIFEKEFSRKIQSGVDLGERMKNAFEDAFSRGNEQIVIIGSDCAELTSNHLEEAFTVLENQDVVIGPSEDGGYYLLGMSTFYPKLFNNINWSTSEVFGQTLANIDSLNLSFDILQSLHDVDTYEDLMRVKHRLSEL